VSEQGGESEDGEKESEGERERRGERERERKNERRRVRERRKRVEAHAREREAGRWWACPVCVFVRAWMYWRAVQLYTRAHVWWSSGRAQGDPRGAHTHTREGAVGAGRGG